MINWKIDSTTYPSDIPFDKQKEGFRYTNTYKADIEGKLFYKDELIEVYWDNESNIINSRTISNNIYE
jgi:hypothetical protein